MFLETVSRLLWSVATTLLLGLHTLLAGTLTTTTPTPFPTQHVNTPYATTTLPVPISNKTKPSVQNISTSVGENENTVAQSVASTTTPPLPQENQEELNTQTRAAVVNIFCTTGAGGYLHPISGSGVIIDSRGVILTNAHVAQYFLLQNYPTPDYVNCIVRTGSPAQSSYTAEVLYLPPEWMSANASQITSQQPMGTGENDYALLLITGSTNPMVSLPTTFPFLPIDIDVSGDGTPVLLVAYPAGFIEGMTIDMNLYASSAFTTIQKLYSFTNNSVDVYSVGGSILAQAGSSGGAVVRGDNGGLIGIITTDTASSTTSGRDLHAITLGYINRGLQADGLGGIVSLLSNNVVDTATVFNSTIAPELTQELINVLQGN